MAQAAAGGQAHGVDIALKQARDTGPQDMHLADGYIFVCPENLASMTGVMKDFFDRTYYPLLGQIEGRPYVTMICAGSDGEGAARQIARIALGWRLKPVADPLIICTHAQTPEQILAPKAISDADRTRCRDLGTALAEGLSLGIF